MLDMGASPFDVGMMIKQTCEAISFPVPPALNKQIQGQLDLFGRPGLDYHAGQIAEKHLAHIWGLMQFVFPYDFNDLFPNNL